MAEDSDIIREFLIESSDSLARLDNEIVALEERPRDVDLLASIFRGVHTIKGTCGFLGFSTLQAITHEAETILSQLRSGQREVSASLVTLVLEFVDAIRTVLQTIEATGEEGPNRYESLIRRLKQVAAGGQLAGGKETQEVQHASPEPAGEGSRAAGEATVMAADSAIRVDVGLLDKLMNLVGELVLARNQILQHNTIHEDRALSATSQRLNMITSELQEGVMKTRMQPIGVIWSKLPRVVRDIANSLGKQIRVDMEGADTELDKTIIEAIKDPLTHLVRNACDHGIERPQARVRAGKPAQGRLLLRAWHEGGQVNIEIADDGGGIDAAHVRAKAVQTGILRPEQASRISDREALNLIFQPGLSTAESVTNISGRGVGMDVVKSNIEKIGGLVDLTSRASEGTTVRLRIPLTLAIIPGLVVTSGGERFVIPQASLLELIRLEGTASAAQIERVHGTPVYRRRGTLLPIAYLNEMLRLEKAGESEVINIVVLQVEDKQLGVVVDSINDTQEIVVKPLSRQLKGLSVYAGATIMGDGKVALILDVAGVGHRSGLLTSSAEQARADKQRESQTEERETAAEAQRLLLFRSSSLERVAVPLSLVARLEEFPQSAVERAGGRCVAQYRDQILPLLSLSDLFEPGSPDTAAAQDPVQVVVFRDGERSAGLVVDRIVDIVEEVVSVRQQTARKGLLGSGVVGGRVTDFLDLHSILHAAGGEWMDSAGSRGAGAAGQQTLVLAEAPAFSRALLRSGLEMAGYRVIEAASAPEVLRILDQRRPDFLVTSLDLPPEGGFALLDAIRARPGLESLPALALTSGLDPGIAPKGRQHDFADYQPKFDWQAMAGSLRRLAAAVDPGDGEREKSLVPA